MPCLVIKKEFIPDSGGPGHTRGGLGQILEVRKLEDDGSPCQVGLYPNGVMTPIMGLFGGHPGGMAKALVHNNGSAPTDLGVGGLTHLTSPTQTVELRIAGGAGYGNPESRSLDRIERDLEQGYITADAASTIYACSLDDSGKVDRDGSARLRQQVE